MSGAIQQLPVKGPLTAQTGQAIRTMRINPGLLLLHNIISRSGT